jgi:integrase/recombinase XerD
MQKLVRRKRSHSLDAPEGPLVDYLAPFESLLAAEGYPSETIRRFLLLIADFSVWLKAQQLPAQEVTHTTAQRYLRYRSRRRRRRKGNAPALRKLVEMLQHNGVVEQEAPVAQTAIEDLVNEYSTYLHQERGLASTTVRKYGRAARLFLKHQRIWHLSELSDLSAQGVIRFFQSESAGRCSTLRTQHLAIGMRSFLRYARYRGYFKPDLAAAIPRVAGWTMTSIPKAISPKDAQRVLASCNRRSTVGRRDYAMLLLLARLGLRACPMDHEGKWPLQYALLKPGAYRVCRDLGILLREIPMEASEDASVDLVCVTTPRAYRLEEPCDRIEG